MKKVLLTFLLLMPLISYGQSTEQYWEKWNSRYPVIDIFRILEYEKNYADSVEKHPRIPPYYARADRYRFDAVYIGLVRSIDKSIYSSMKNVYKLFVGNPSILNDIFDSEVLIKLGQYSMWMPVQRQILVALKEEVITGDTLTLYCLYLNEHSKENGLRNIFLISEFTK
jgi:hypothetical protein